MNKVISVFCFVSVAASLMAAPTANEDFVVSEDAKTFTNAVNASNEYTDRKVAAIDAVTPVIATNISGSVTSNVVNRAYVEALGVSAGLTTNDVRGIVAEKRDKLDRGFHEVITEWVPGSVFWQDTANVYYDSVTFTDGVWCCVLRYGPGSGRLVEMLGSENHNPDATELVFPNGTPTVIVRQSHDDALALESDVVAVSNALNSAKLDRSGGIVSGELQVYGNLSAHGDYLVMKDTVLSGGRSGVIATAEEIEEAVSGKASSSDVQDLQAQVAPLAEDIRNAYLYSRSINLYMTANTNAWFAGTNYVFGADAASRHRFSWEPGMDAATVPCSMALYENRDGSKQRVWDQRDWVSWYWTFKANQMRSEIAATNAQIYAAITNDANNAWAKRYAATGRVNPDASTTYIDTKAVCLSPGMNWETVANVGGCGYWTIVGNGAVIGGSGTNAVLDIKDFEGNSILRIAKGEHRLAWLESSDFVGSMTDADGWVCFDMMASVQPVGYFSTSLVSSDFVAESDAGCPAQYLWENLGNGKWRVHFLLKPGIASNACFAKFQVEIEGKTQVEYEAGVSIKGGLIYNGVTIAPVIPQNVAVGDTITWKVIAK